MNRERFEALKEKITVHKVKAADLVIIVREISKLPPGQLKKVLTDEVLAVLAKYGYTE